MTFPNLKTGILAVAASAVISAISASGAAAQSCPDWQLGGVPISANAEAAFTPQSYQIFAGGLLNLGSCEGILGAGHITQAPNFTLQYDGATMVRDLELRVEAQCDTTLLVNTAGGQWEFVDDMDDSFSPRLTLPNAMSGQYDIWVGSYGPEACQATLIAQTFEHQPLVCPDRQLGGAEVRLTTGMSDQRPVLAGGPINLFQADCGIPAHGFLAQAPELSLNFDNLSQVSTLQIYVTGDCDQTLLIADPGGNWIFNDDDAENLNPSVTIGDAVSGRYDIWVGTYDMQTCQSTISVLARTPDAPQAPATPSK